MTIAQTTDGADSVRFPRALRRALELERTFAVMLQRLSLILVLLSIAFAADGQALKQRKPGLWELQYIDEESERRAEQAAMGERLRNMTPERRAQMDAYLKQHGVGMSLGAGGAPTMTMRFCLTPQDIARETTSNLLKGMQEHDCNTTVLAQSANEVHVHATCANTSEGTREIDARIYDVSADHYAVDMETRSRRGDNHIQQKARWLGNECSGAF
jgi:hypothetical protein